MKRSSSGGRSGVRQAAEQKPQHIKYIEQMLNKQGVNFYEKNVASQLIEFTNYYTCEMINEGQVNRRYRDKEGTTPLSNNDLKLAIKFKHINTFTRPISTQTVQRVAQERNDIPLAQLVLGPQAPQLDRFKGQISSYYEQIQEKAKNVNMNAMPVPQKGPDGHNSTFRLDQPNIQITSEELLMQIQQRNKDLYGLTLKDRFKEISAKPVDVQVAQDKKFVAPQNLKADESSLLGKREKPENSIMIDEKSIVQQTEESRQQAEIFKKEQQDKLNASLIDGNAVNSTLNSTYQDLQKKQRTQIDNSILLQKEDQDPVDFENLGSDEDDDDDMFKKVDQPVKAEQAQQAAGQVNQMIPTQNPNYQQTTVQNPNGGLAATNQNEAMDDGSGENQSDSGSGEDSDDNILDDL